MGGKDVREQECMRKLWLRAMLLCCKVLLIENSSIRMCA